MLTDDEASAIEAAHAADPGVEPDGFSWEHLDKVPDRRAWLDEKRELWAKDGMKYCRVTVVEERNEIWFEVWREVPTKEAPFKGHYTAGSPDTR